MILLRLITWPYVRKHLVRTALTVGGIVLQIDDLGSGEGIDAETGLVDLPVEGVLLRHNKPIASVRHARLSGDLRVVLGKLVEVCSDTDRIGHVDAPAMIVDGFSVSEDRAAPRPKRSSVPPAAKAKAKAKR